MNAGPPERGPRYLTAADLQGLGLTIGRVADVLEEAFRQKAAGGVVSPPMTFFHRERSAWFNSMVCWIPALGFAGCKFQSGDSANPARGLPSIQGLYVLCEGVTGRMVALMDSRAPRSAPRCGNARHPRLRVAGTPATGGNQGCGALDRALHGL
jgi:ornithine cyclodeaminase/alanine dehydrogenase-like protein (mu-crystallin family)